MTWLTELIGVVDYAEGIFKYTAFILRYFLPLFALLIIIRCAKSLFNEKQEDEIWGWLTSADGHSIPLKHWENTIGKVKKDDVKFLTGSFSPGQAALIRDAKGRWKLYNFLSQDKPLVNGEVVTNVSPIETGDTITFGDKDYTFVSISEDEEREAASLRTKPGGRYSPGVTFFLLTEFQLLLCIAEWISQGDETVLAIPICFGALILLSWCYYFFMRIIRRRGFEMEILAFLLSSVGIAVCASSAPSSLYKQTACLIIGIIGFLILGWFLRDLNRTKKLRVPLAVGGIALLAINILFAGKIFGAKNWLSIGGFSLQPSEFVKICFVFAGAATLDKLFSKKNLFWFIFFSGVCVIALVLMSDFGTALVFFATYIVIAFLRSGNFATVLLSIGGAGFAAVLAVSVKPYIATRFSTWLHAWDYASSGGYQQTRTMIAAASGGLFGVGAGNGWLHRVFAADTDMVFGLVCEELGLLVGLLCITAFILLAFFIIRSASTARSSFYVIGAAAALTCMMVQIMLNCFGAFDILPFTGVTFPFLSKGGSSMISCWCLLAFIKACDTRQNASFAVRLPKRKRKQKSVPVEALDEEALSDEGQA